MVTELLVVSATTMLFAIGYVALATAQSRRYALGFCGVLQLSLALVVAGGITLQAAPSLAAENDEEAFFLTDTADRVALTSTSPIIPPGRPNWIAAVKSIKPEDNWTVASSGPFVTKTEADAELTNQIKTKADDYINFLLQSKVAAQLLQYKYDAETLRQRLVKSDDLYAETIQSPSVGPMQQVHARVEFPQWFQDEIKEEWRKLTLASRLGKIGLIGGVLLSLLGTVFGFFKANQANGQRGSTSLQLGAAAAILVIVVAGVSVASYMYWL